ncbi:LOW QUALITY PROTEIN: glutamate-rich protein 6, partial [Athene cunicularia]|uniref:LOW QUALITY PROTEIN: glutamate-rich protein 6 n=1 Tax=Athene cunicularia TaxID=194338 RepID=UPI000EF729B8
PVGLCLESREAETSGSVEAVAARELPGLSVPTQTGAGGLHRHADREPTPSEEFSSLDVLCDTEFEGDFVKLFKKSLCTLPSVGLPALLAHRPEASRENLQIQAEEGCAPRCEYCGSLLRPFPSLEDPGPPPQGYAWKFCCERNQDLYEFIVRERRGREGAGSVLAAVGPREPLGTHRLSQGRADQRQRERRVARQLAFLAAEPTAAAECSHQAGTISYLLSQEPPSPAGRTLVPAESRAEPAEEPEEEPGVTCCDFSPAGGGVVKDGLLEKYYRHGGKFLTMLPDGTAQLFYPSGNLAIVVIREKARATCIVREDEARTGAVRAVFTSAGRSTCYYPDGAVWINLNVEGGQYLDRAGSRVRRWTWPNRVVVSGPPVPLRPVFIALNQHVGVRILGQDKITVSFLAGGQQAKLNVGTKVQASAGGQRPPPTRLGKDELLLLTLRLRILRLLDRIRWCLNFPSNEQRDRTKPPAVLPHRPPKISQLCTAPDVGEELHSSLWAMVNAVCPTRGCCDGGARPRGSARFPHGHPSPGALPPQTASIAAHEARRGAVLGVNPSVMPPRRSRTASALPAETSPG